MAAHLVEHCALRRQNVPIGLVGRMGAVEHLQSLIVISGLGQAPGRMRRAPPCCAGFRSRPSPARRRPVRVARCCATPGHSASRYRRWTDRRDIAGRRLPRRGADRRCECQRLRPVTIRPATKPVVSAVCMVWHPAIAVAITASSAAEESRRVKTRVGLTVGRIVIAAKTGRRGAGRSVTAGWSAIDC